MFLLPVLFCLLQAPVPKPEPVPPARIELTTPFPVHLGSVGPREVREAVFGIKSIHDRPFRFRVLDLSMGLSLDAAQLAEPLRPGETRPVVVKVDPAGMEGPVKGGIRLGTDDPSQPVYILRLDLTVRPEVTVDSSRKSLGEVAPHERPEVRFQFLREGGDPLKVTLDGSPPTHLEAELLQEGTSTDLRVTLHPERLKPGITAGLEIFKVQTNAPRQPQFTLYVDWRLATPVVPVPSRLVFSEPKTTLLGLQLTARDGKPFRILQAEIQGRGFQLLDQPGPEADRHVLRVRRLGKVREALLLLHCSNQTEPLRVPLRYLDPNERPAKVAPPPPGPTPEHPHRH